MVRFAFVALGITALIGAPIDANAKAVKRLEYAFGPVWSTTVRFLRVDKSYPVAERDKEAGYIMFTYPGSGAVKKCRATLEIIAAQDEQHGKHLRVQLNIAHQPSYIEHHMLEALEIKLRREHGPPRVAPTPPPKKPDPPKKEK